MMTAWAAFYLGAGATLAGLTYLECKRRGILTNLSPFAVNLVLVVLVFIWPLVVLNILRPRRGTPPR